VIIDFTKDRVRVTISDNGRGFELAGRVDDLPRIGKLGLVGMQERARLLGGTLEVQTTPGKGTTLIVEVPG
jgi:signal transduction histidine kinase